MFESADTKKEVVDIIAKELKLKPVEITDTITFEQMGADSLDIVQIIMKLEERFGIEIHDKDAEKMLTLPEVVEYVHQRRSK